MKTKINSIAIMIVLLAPVCLQAQQLRWQWAVQANSTGNSRISGTACDTAGHIYLTGSFSDTVRFGQQELIPMGDDDIYWVKFDTLGKVLWAQQAGGEGRDIPTAMAVSETGQIYTAGICGKDAFKQAATGARRINFFISCHNHEGELQWVKTFGAKRSDYIAAIAIDTVNRIYFGGYFEQRLDIKDGQKDYQLTAAGGRDAFVACINEQGEVAWANSWGGSGADRITALRYTATNDRILLLGDCDAPLENITPPEQRTAVFTAVCHPDGTVEAINSLISGQAVDARCITETADGLLLVGGNFYDSLSIGTNVLRSHGSCDMFVAAIDTAGVAWHQQLGSTAYDRLFDILLHSWEEEHIVITGLYSDTLYCGDNTVEPGNDFCDVFTASFSHDGRLQEVNPMGGRAEEFPQVMTHGREGHVFVAGLFRDTTQLRGNTLVTPTGSDELFLAKLYHCNKNRIVFSCDTVFFEGDLLTLEVQGSYVRYEWELGESTAPNYIVSCSKTYQVLVSDSLNCVYRDSITIRQKPVFPKVQIRAEAPAQWRNNSMDVPKLLAIKNEDKNRYWMRTDERYQLVTYNQL